MQADRSYKSKNRDGRGRDRRDGRRDEPVKKIKVEDLPRLPYEKALEAHKLAMDRGARCTECALFGLRAGPVMDVVVPNARLTILAEAPGQNECAIGIPMVGKSGMVADEAVAEGGLSRDECTIANVCLCRPPEEFKAYEFRQKVNHELACQRAREQGLEEPPAPITPADCCFPRLEKTIEESNAKVVLSLGGPALRAVAEHWDVPFGPAKKVKYGEVRIASLKKQIGSPVTMPDGTIVVASFHPAFAMRAGSRHYMHIIRRFISRAAEIAVRGHIDWSEPPFILNPTVEQIEETLGLMYRSGAPVTIDIETDKGTRLDGEFDPFSCRIRCIGFGAVIDGREILICVPIRRIDGSEWWDREDKRDVLQACMNVLNTNPLVGHNLAFDTGVLLRFGLISEQNRTRTYDDTMIMAHDTIDCDLPKDLGFVAARYFEVPAWKGAADDKYYERITDEDLQLYNVRDILTCMRLHPAMLDQVYACGTTPQYELDQELAPIFRDMGELGLIVDERRRGELSLQMGAEAKKRLVRLKEIVKDPKFNPNSPPQVRAYLFRQKKLIPCINTKGKDWEDGEDPATNVGALTKLVLQQSPDAEAREFINTLLEFRAYMKLKGTYLDKLRVTYEDWTKYGLTVETVPEVKGEVWVKYRKKERLALLQQRFEDEWNALPQVLKGLAKDERRRQAQLRKAKLEALLTRIEDGYWNEVVVMPERPALSRLHTTWALHIVSSGRVSARPACQNWPEAGKANMRDMIVAPPGHVMVGADLDQVELRLYAAIAGDRLLLEAFAKKYDPHSYNAASLFTKRFGREWGRSVTVHEVYEYIVALPTTRGAEYAEAVAKKLNLPMLTQEQAKLLSELFDNDEKAVAAVARSGVPVELVEAFLVGHAKGAKEKKKLRGYAKTFCIAEGQRVLTPRGEVPIEKVGKTDLVWDGAEWVFHDGVVYQGVREVIEYDGIRATRDHKVWLEDGTTCSLESAKIQGRRLERADTQTRTTPPPCDANPCVTRARTYDLLNAGPRRRFTVEGVIVSNCYLEAYGGEAEKLGSFMITARDKATGALMFPDLKMEDVLEWHIEWHRMHPETKRWQDLCSRTARIEGYTSTPMGSYRKRFFPGGANKNGATFNHLTQGSAAEIANAAVKKIAKAIPFRSWSPFTGLFLQVHDYIGVIVPIERAEEAKRIVEEAMNTVVFGIPITAKAKVSERWSKQ